MDPNANPNPAPDTPDVAQALLLVTSRLEAIETRLTAVEGAKTQTPQSEAENGLPASANTAATDSDPDADKGDKDEDDKPAMDANAVQAAITAALTAERARAQGVQDAKTACRSDLGDMIAMDDAGEIYKAALKTRGVDVSSMSAEVAKATYQAVSAVTPRATVQYANDAAGGKPTFDTSRIRSAGRA